MLEIKDISKHCGRKVAIYGGTIWGEIAFDYLIRHGYDIVAVCDLRLFGNAFRDRVIEPPEAVLDHTDAAIVVCATHGFHSMCDYLEEHGIIVAYHMGSIIQKTDFTRVHAWDVYTQDYMMGRYMHFVNEYLELVGGMLEFTQLGISVNSMCNLKCKFCNYAVPYTKNENFDRELQIEQIGKLLDAADRFYKVGVIGGEVFLSSDMHRVVNCLARSNKVDMVEVRTNSTIIPSGENLRCLSQPKVRLVLDDYGELSTERDELIRLCEQKQIDHAVMSSDYWYDFSDFSPQGYSDEEKRKTFRSCMFSSCYVLYDTVLTRCISLYAAALTGKIPNI